MRWLIALSLGALSAALLRREARMPWAREFADALARDRGSVGAAILMGNVEARHAQLLRSRPRFLDPRLRWHVEHQLLPVIALYETVEQAEGRASAAAAVDAAMGAVSKASLLGPVLTVIELLARPFDIFRRLILLGAPIATPPSGWSIQITADNEHELTFLVRRCFYVDVLGALGHPELVPKFCSLDDRRYGQLRKVAFSRTGTIATGASQCDFHFAPREEALDRVTVS